MLSPADLSWLLLTPLSRRGILRRAALTAAVGATLAGALLGVLALAMAGPYLRPEGGSLPGSWLVLSAVAGAGSCLAAVAAEALAQPGARTRVLVRAACAALAVVATGGCAGRPGVDRADPGGYRCVRRTDHAGLRHRGDRGRSPWPPSPGCSCGGRWPPSPPPRCGPTRRAPGGHCSPPGSSTSRCCSGSPRTTTGAAACSGQGPGRNCPRPWRLPGRTGGGSAAGQGRSPSLAIASVFPALLGAAFTGRAHGILIAAAPRRGRDGGRVAGDSPLPGATPTAPRCAGCSAWARGRCSRPAPCCPSLLSRRWLALALTVLSAVGALAAGSGRCSALAGPGVAAGVLATGPHRAGQPGRPGSGHADGQHPALDDLPVLSVMVAAIGSYPLLAAVVQGHDGTGKVVAQPFVLRGRARDLPDDGGGHGPLIPAARWSFRGPGICDITLI